MGRSWFNYQAMRWRSRLDAQIEGAHSEFPLPMSQLTTIGVYLPLIRAVFENSLVELLVCLLLNEGLYLLKIAFYKSYQSGRTNTSCGRIATHLISPPESVFVWSDILPPWFNMSLHWLIAIYTKPQASIASAAKSSSISPPSIPYAKILC